MAARANLEWMARTDAESGGWRDVVRTSYHFHRSRKNPDGPPLMRVEYHQAPGMRPQKISEWVGIEHTGGFGGRARAWWAQRTREQFPESVDHAVALARMGCLRSPSRIQAHKTGEGYWRITEHVLGGSAEPLTAEQRERARHPFGELETDNDCPF